MSDILVIALLMLLNVQIYTLARGMGKESVDLARRHSELLEALGSEDDDVV